MAHVVIQIREWNESLNVWVLHEDPTGGESQRFDDAVRIAQRGEWVRYWTPDGWRTGEVAQVSTNYIGHLEDPELDPDFSPFVDITIYCRRLTETVLQLS